MRALGRIRCVGGIRYVGSSPLLMSWGSHVKKLRVASAGYVQFLPKAREEIETSVRQLQGTEDCQQAE